MKHFIAACNANDIVPEYLQTEKYTPKKAVATISNAMDVGNPSNFIRVLEIFQHQFPALKKALSSYSVTDDATRATIKNVFDQEHYLLDPHGAVGFFALNQYLSNHPGQQGFILETAHPVKFYDVVEPVINEKVPLPPVVEAQMSLAMKKTTIAVDSALLKGFLLSLK